MPDNRTPESGVPIMEQLKRMLPGFLGGYPGDTELPRQPGIQRDPRLPAPSPLEALREGLQGLGALGAPSPEEQALKALKQQR